MGRHSNKGGLQEYPNCGACKESVEHVLFEFSSYDTQRQDFFDYLTQVLLPDDFEALFCGSVFVKTLVCLKRKQDMLVKDESSSWYNRVGDFVLLV